MRVTFTTNDRKEIKRLTKADDMAFFIFDLVCNSRKGCYTKCETQNVKSPEDGVDIVFDRIKELLDQNAIDIDDILE